MTDSIEQPLYDEDDAVLFIRKQLPQEIADKYTDDDLLYIVDTIWDYYESKGPVSMADTPDEEVKTNIASLTAYIKKEIKKDSEFRMDFSDVEHIINAELTYEKNIGIFDD